MGNMKPGRTVTIRVNPRDALSAIDVVQQADIRIQGMSFAQVVSLAFSSLLQACREEGLIPKRDGFEYEEMMSQFPANANHARKLAITKTVEGIGSEARVPPPVPMPQSNELVRIQHRWRELAARKEADPLNWTEQDQTEMNDLFKKLFPAE